MTSKLLDKDAITVPLIADAPAYDDQPRGITNFEWCVREGERINGKGDSVRLITRGRLCWLSRAPERKSRKAVEK
jgi:hypothetical protein